MATKHSKNYYFNQTKHDAPIDFVKTGTKIFTRSGVLLLTAGGLSGLTHLPVVQADTTLPPAVNQTPTEPLTPLVQSAVVTPITDPSVMDLQDTGTGGVLYGCGSS